MELTKEEEKQVSGFQLENPKKRPPIRAFFQFLYNLDRSKWSILLERYLLMPWSQGRSIHLIDSFLTEKSWPQILFPLFSGHRKPLPAAGESRLFITSMELFSYIHLHKFKSEDLPPPPNKEEENPSDHKINTDYSGNFDGVAKKKSSHVNNYSNPTSTSDSSSSSNPAHPPNISIINKTNQINASLKNLLISNFSAHYNTTNTNTNTNTSTSTTTSTTTSTSNSTTTSNSSSPTLSHTSFSTATANHVPVSALPPIHSQSLHNLHYKNSEDRVLHQTNSLSNINISNPPSPSSKRVSLHSDTTDLVSASSSSSSSATTHSSPSILPHPIHRRKRTSLTSFHIEGTLPIEWRALSMQELLMNTLNELDEYGGWEEESVKIARLIIYRLLGSVIHISPHYKEAYSSPCWPHLFQILSVIEHFIFYRPSRTGLNIDGDESVGIHIDHSTGVCFDKLLVERALQLLNQSLQIPRMCEHVPSDTKLVELQKTYYEKGMDTISYFTHLMEFFKKFEEMKVDESFAAKLSSMTCNRGSVHTHIAKNKLKTCILKQHSSILQTKKTQKIREAANLAIQVMGDQKGGGVHAHHPSPVPAIAPLPSMLKMTSSLSLNAQIHQSVVTSNMEKDMKKQIEGASGLNLMQTNAYSKLSSLSLSSSPPRESAERRAIRKIIELESKLYYTRLALGGVVFVFLTSILLVKRRWR